MFASLPLVLHHILGMSSDLMTPGPIHVHSVVDSSVFLAFAVFLTWNAMWHLIVASDARPSAVSFLKSLGGTVEEFAQSQQSSQMPLQFHSAISPTKGLTVADLWAAHTAKRAWAVRGAHFSCRNGEVVVILGDDGAGKSRLLTAISEAIVAPPCQSLSTTRVRGSITFGGVDVTKWDRGQIKKRLGLVLNDVRSVSATADLFSGLTLEEILEPLDVVHQPGEPHILSTQEKNAMGMALQVRRHKNSCDSSQ
jgi:ABC-type protease/lipase transport system fused ATPase/permease subunit